MINIVSFRHHAGLLDEEAAALAGLTKEQGHKRCPDLRNGDPAWIIPIDQARVTEDGQLARQCTITVAGLEAFRKYLSGETTVTMRMPPAHARNSDPWTSHLGIPRKIRIESHMQRLLYVYAAHHFDRCAHER